MAATVTTGANDGHWVLFTSTLAQEIVDELGDQNLSGNKIVGFANDGTSFFVLACRRGR